MLRIALTTLGCRTNQVETEAIRHALDDGAGEVRIVPWTAPADVYVINTCTVTARADRQCRQQVHRAHRRAPEAAIVITGCYAESDATTLAALPGVVAVLGPGHRGEIGRTVAAVRSGQPAAVTIHTGDLDGAIGTHRVDRHPGRTRVPIKVQEGCDSRCSYCIVPAVRGPSRSLSAADVVSDARQLAAAGHPEIVVAGTHVGRWGRDLRPRQRIEELVGALLAGVPGIRIRLSSLDVAEVTPGLVDLLADEERIARHLHLTLQHTDPAVLARMHRRSPTGGLAARVAQIGEQLPGFGLGADVIAGFPGEDRTTFETLAYTLEQLPLSYLHVFGFSARPGTLAADLPDPVDGPERRRRVAALRTLSEERLAPRFAAGLVGRRTVAVLERAGEGDRTLGTGSEFVPVAVDGGRRWLGAAVPIRITGLEGKLAIGRIEGRQGNAGSVTRGGGC
jgi:threonylcarbamoyladenosine tRNA methylthiotransferase MtaB